MTIDGTSLEGIQKVRDSLLNRTYEFGVSKLVYVPKIGKDELRPLAIPPYQDRLVQEVMRTILETIYEPIFSNHSHGFRPGRSQHTALRHLKALSNGFNWCIEGDVSNFFDSMDHTVLLTLLSKKIKDPKFINLINKMLKTKIMAAGNPIAVNYVGSPQGSIISPLLSNILLHEFDTYMENYIRAFNKGKSRKRNNAYDRLYRKGGVKAARSVLYYDPKDPAYRRVHYVRYADDFLITLIGSKQDAVNIKRGCTSVLNHLKLTLHQDKTLISNPQSAIIRFLGYIV